MNSLRMTPAGQSSGTGPLNPPRTQDAAARFLPAAEAASPFGGAAAGPAVFNQVATLSRDCLTSVAIVFPEPGPVSAAPSPAESEQIARGQSLLQNLEQRSQLTDDGSPGRRPLDFALARLSTEALHYPLALGEFTRVLQILQQDLPGFRPGAPPLSRQAVDEINAGLKPFGLMTDGKNLYNLAIRSGADPQTGKRMPMTCGPRELHQLLDVCSALKHRLAAVPAQAYTPDSRFRPTSLENATQPLQTDPLGQSPASLAASALLSQIQSRRQQYAELLSNGQSFVQDSAAMLERLLPQQAQIDSRIEAEMEQQSRLQSQAEQQAQALAPLEAIGRQAQSPQGLTGLSPQELAQYRQALAPLGLGIDRTHTGEIRFTQAGQRLTAQAFRQALADALARQTRALAETRLALGQSQTRLSELCRQSAELGSQIETANARLAQGLDLVAQAETLARQNRQDILRWRDDPALWSRLGPAQQDLLNQELGAAEDALTQASKATTRGRDLLARSQEQLARSERLRQRAERMQQQSADLLQRLDALLNGQLQARLLNREAEVQDLIRLANALEAELCLAPAPDPSRLRDLVRIWSEALQGFLKESQDMHRSRLELDGSGRQAFDRRAQVLREHLVYHQQALEQFASLRHEELTRELQQYLQAFRGLSRA